MSINIKAILGIILLTDVCCHVLHAEFAPTLNSVDAKNENNKALYTKEDLPTSLLLELVDDAKGTSDANEKVGVIAGFRVKDLEEEIKKREKHPSIIGLEKQLNPANLSNDLLLWLANQTETFGGITPDNALMEFQKRVHTVADDNPQSATIYALEQEVDQNRANSLKQFNDREINEEIHDLADNVKKEISLEQDPSINAQIKQIEKEQGQKHKLLDAYVDYIQDKKYDGDQPHGYDEEIQYDRNGKEVQAAQEEIAENEPTENTWLEQTKSFFNPEEKNIFSQDVKDEKELQKQAILRYIMDDTTQW